MEQKPANIGLRSQYALRLYSWAKKYVEDGAKTISLEELRGVRPGVGKGCGRKVIQEAPLPVWANFQQRASMRDLEINTKTDLKIKLASMERSKHRRVAALNFMIKTQAIPRRRTNSETRSSHSCPRCLTLWSR